MKEPQLIVFMIEPVGEQVEHTLHEVGVGVVGLAERVAAVDEHEGQTPHGLHALDQVQQHAVHVHRLRELRKEGKVTS